MLFGAPFNRWYTVIEVSLQWISWKKQSSQSGPSCHSVSLTAQLINCVLGFNALSSSKEDTLNILCNEIHPCNVTVKIIHQCFPTCMCAAEHKCAAKAAEVFRGRMSEIKSFQ